MSGDDAVVVEGVYEHGRGSRGHFLHHPLPLLGSIFTKSHLRAVATDGIHFDFGRVVGHDDVGLCSHHRGGVGNGLSVVAGRVRGDTSGLLLGR